MSPSILPILLGICFIFNLQSISAQKKKFSEWKYSTENFPNFYTQNYLGLEFRPMNAAFTSGVLNYTSPDPAFLSFSESTPTRSRSLAVMFAFDQEMVIFNRLLVRFGTTANLSIDHHLEYNIGLGYQQQVYKKRPIFLRALLQYDYWNYAVRMGNIQNDSLNLKIGKRDMKASNVNIFLGNRVHSMRAILGFSVDLIPNLGLYVEGSYLVLSSNQSRAYFKNNAGLPWFRRKRSMPLEDPSLNFAQAGVTTNQFNVISPLAFKIGIVVRNTFDIEPTSLIPFSGR